MHKLESMSRKIGQIESSRSMSEIAIRREYSNLTFLMEVEIGGACDAEQNVPNKGPNVPEYLDRETIIDKAYFSYKKPLLVCTHTQAHLWSWISLSSQMGHALPKAAKLDKRERRADLRDAKQTCSAPKTTPMSIQDGRRVSWWALTSGGRWQEDKNDGTTE